MSDDACTCGCSTAAETTDESNACECGCNDSHKAGAGESR